MKASGRREITESTGSDGWVDAIDPTFRSVAESLTDSIMLLDRDGLIRYINHTVPDLTVAQVLGTSVYLYVPEEYRDVMRRCHERVLASGQADRYETAYVPEGGEVSWWETRVSPVMRGGLVVALVQIASNVTERRQAAADRDRLFNLSIDMLCVAGSDGYFKRINPAVSHTLGYTDEELLARPLLEFVHPEDRERTTAEVARLVKGEQVIDFDNRYRCRDGSYRWISWRAAPDTTGKLIHAIGRDVTERRALERQLRQSQKMDAVGRLAGGIAHDFNNLLLAIDLNVELMARAPDGEKHAQYAGEARRATQRAADLTRQLLALGRRPDVVFRPVDLNAIVRGMLTLVRRLLPESIEILFDAQHDVPAVRADAGQVEQVVLNLCLNARDAMPEGGRLVIATRSVPGAPGASSPGRGETDGGLDGADGSVTLRVTDSGMGMSAEVRERVFEPFFTTKPQGQGTGLGLTMVYGIVHQHGGSVRVESEPGRGASFEVSLPATRQRVTRASDAPVGQAIGGHETILVAEDEAGVRSGVVRLLEDAGYRVLVATHGEEAVDLFARHASEVALVLLDLVMPRLGGSAAALRMRALRADLPVVLTSGYGHAPQMVVTPVPQALHLDKPYASEALLRIVREALDRPAA